MTTPSALLKVMIDAVRKTARGLTRDFGEVAELQVSKKGAADFVSAADLKAEQTLFEELTRVRPGYGFLGEERGEEAGTDKTHRWIVDPLDGTTNFLHGIPHFAINVALERDGVVVAAVTYNPVTHDLFWGERGRGAFWNDKRLRVSARSRMDEALIATGIPFLGRAALRDDRRHRDTCQHRRGRELGGKPGGGQDGEVAARKAHARTLASVRRPPSAGRSSADAGRCSRRRSILRRGCARHPRRR